MEAAARRRRWFDSGDGTMAVLLASMSDLDDLLPTLVAYQIEWNKLATLARVAGVAPRRRGLDAQALAEAIGGTGRGLGPRRRGLGRRPAGLPRRGRSGTG